MTNLSLASLLKVGNLTAQKVYLGATEVWSAAAQPDVDFWNDASSQINGTSVTAGNSASSGVAFDSVGGTVVKYVSDGKDGVGFEVDPNSDTGSAYLRWDDPTTGTQASLGFWYRQNVGNTLNRRATDVRSTTDGTLAGIGPGTVSGTLRAFRGSTGMPDSQSPALTLGDWYWVSLGVDTASGAGELIFKIYEADGTPFHSWVYDWTAATGDSIGYVRFIRALSSTPNDATYDMFQYQPGDPASLGLPTFGGATGREALVYGEYQPDASTTGTQGTLTPYSGTYTTSADNEVIENLDIDGRLIIQHSGVTVRNCRITSATPPGGTTSWPIVQMWQTHTTPTLVIDCEIDASGFPVVGSTEGAAGVDFIMRRCNIHGTVDGVKANYGSVTVEGCWIHDLPWYAVDPTQVDGSHNDGIQGIGSTGQTTAGFVFRGNSIECGENGTSGILVTQPSGYSVHGLVIDRNWFVSTELRASATAVGLNLSQSGTSTAFVGDIEITGNRFTAWDGSQDSGKGWEFDHDAIIDAETYDKATISGNTWMDGTTPAKITRLP